MSLSHYGLHQDAGGLKNSLSRDVYEKLLLRFLRNELVPGDILNRRMISQQLGVSVAPVLEALLQLEMEGFVESIPRKGTIVRPIRQEDVYGQLMLREAVECQAARLYCGAPVSTHRASMDLLASPLESGEPDTPEHWKQEIDFHGALVELANCPALSNEFMRIMRLSSFIRLNRILNQSDKLERQSHLALLDVLSRDDPDGAEQAIRAHLRSGKHNVFR
jgi:DNA-binding GntR family transcriptional regulator